MYTEQLSQALSIAAAPIHPVSVSPGTTDSGGIDMSRFLRATFLLNVGAFGASATVDMKLQESADGSSYADMAVSGSSITQLVAAGGNNRLATLEVRAGQLSPGKRFVRARVVVGTAATILCCIPIGSPADYKPASQNDIAEAFPEARAALRQRFRTQPSPKPGDRPCAIDPKTKPCKPRD